MGEPFLKEWLNITLRLSKEVKDIAEDFSNGYLFGEILHKHKLIPNFDSYKKTNDFKNALHAAALATAGSKDEDLLGKIRTNTLGYLEKDKADYAKAAALELLYEDYSKERRGLQNIAKFLKYDLKPELMRVGENVASARRIYAPIYGSIFNGFGLKQYDEKNKK